MDPVIKIEKRVDVVVTYKRKGDINSLCMPCKMRFEGREIDLTKKGLRHPTTQGHRMIHVFDMTDGNNDYRLEFDAEALTWMLMEMIPGGTSA